MDTAEPLKINAFRQLGLGSAFVLGLMACGIAGANAQDAADPEVESEDGGAAAESTEETGTTDAASTDEDATEDADSGSAEQEVQDDDESATDGEAPAETESDETESDEEEESTPSDEDNDAEEDEEDDFDPDDWDLDDDNEDSTDDDVAEDEDEAPEEDGDLVDGAGEDLAVANLNNLEPEDLIAWLIGDDTSAHNIEVIGDPSQLGLFQNFDAIDIERGLVLSTGVISTNPNISPISGPNDWEYTGEDLGQPGDSDLETILEEALGEPATTYDAAGLQFDFVPTDQYVSYSYVFGSEEYPEYVGSIFNDVFAFLVNGVNYATFESETGERLPVAINTINHLDNTSLYNSNSGDELNTYATGLDGFTNVLQFTAPVNPGELNTLKLVIADVGDGVYDSLVFIQEGSFQQANPPQAEENLVVTTEVDTPVHSELGLSSSFANPVWEYELVTAPVNGTVVFGNSFTYTPDSGFIGEDFFQYLAFDGVLWTDEPIGVTILVTEPAPEPAGETGETDGDAEQVTAGSAESAAQSVSSSDTVVVGAAAQDSQTATAHDSTDVAAADSVTGAATSTDSAHSKDELASTGAAAQSVVGGAGALLLAGAGLLFLRNRREARS